ncbi:PadR family transcriptional regulator [Phytohabitans suffuscus]|uniref:PadR family transcriptional regulator n=1 Tax=Phytohabitans suffuscus TaxID=624315 RepID=A0A6F8YQT9_9ACTN|nr:PadR family transcriptional regulator [Phytohabitans suffuscus]BCB88278.1 PadR family transcriptional regulator [Phytohabitans suffuscus]
MLDEELLSTHQQELRRGTVVLACLLILRKPNYGYALLDLLERSGFAVDANTLYPLLRRLEKQGLLTSDWNTDESRPRKFYRTSDLGAELAGTLSRDWDELHAAFHTLKDGS